MEFQAASCSRRCCWPLTGATATAVWNGRGERILLIPLAHQRVRRKMVYLTRKLEFSASHLYHNPVLSAEENKRVYGKCNNPHGHGHDYVVEVAVSGTVDPATGMIANLADLDGFVEGEVLEA